MLFSERSIWTMVHGIGLGGAALLGLAAALFHLYAAYEIVPAHVLRRLGRYAEAAEAWAALAAGPGRTAVVASVEQAKLQEHRLGQPEAALRTALHGLSLAERRRHFGMPEPGLEADLCRRLLRLRRRTATTGAARPSADLRLDHHLRARTRHDEPPDAFTDRPRPDGRQIRDAGQPDVLDRQ